MKKRVLLLSSFLGKNNKNNNNTRSSLQPGEFLPVVVALSVALRGAAESHRGNEELLSTTRSHRGNESERETRLYTNKRVYI